MATRAKTRHAPQLASLERAAKRRRSARMQLAIDLPEHAVVRLDGDQRGLVLRCETGVSWVTQEQDGLDHVLRAGQRFVVRQPGVVVIEALRHSRIAVGATAS
jgi:hypothetical protein